MTPIIDVAVTPAGVRIVCRTCGRERLFTPTRAKQWLQRHYQGCSGRERGKPVVIGPPHRWTPEEDAVLLSVTPDEAAELLDRSRDACMHRRVRLGHGISRKWTAEEDAILLAAATLDEAVEQLPHRPRGGCEARLKRLLQRQRAAA